MTVPYYISITHSMTKHNLMELIGNYSGTLPLTVPLWNYTELIVQDHINSVYVSILLGDCIALL